MNMIWDRIAGVVEETGLTDEPLPKIRKKVERTIPSIVAFLSMTEIFLVPLEKEYAGMSNKALADLLENLAGVPITGTEHITQEHREMGYNLLRDLIEVYKIFKIKI